MPKFIGELEYVIPHFFETNDTERHLAELSVCEEGVQAPSDLVEYCERRENYYLYRNDRDVFLKPDGFYVQCWNWDIIINFEIEAETEEQAEEKASQMSDENLSLLLFEHNMPYTKNFDVWEAGES